MQEYTCPYCGATVEFDADTFRQEMAEMPGGDTAQALITLQCQACYTAAGWVGGAGRFVVNIDDQQIVETRDQSQYAPQQ